MQLFTAIRHVVLLSLLLATIAADGQQGKMQNAKSIDIIGDSIVQPSAIFQGEVHAIYEGDTFKFELIRWAHRRFGINNVVMEMGKADAYLFNQYFQKGDTTILSYYGHSQDVMERLRQWERLYRDTKCTLWGIDFEREEYVAVVLSILRKYPSAQTSALYSYLASQANMLDGEDDVTHRKKHIKNYEKAQAIFRSEKEELKPILANDYVTVEGILLNSATERQMKKRDEAMEHNLVEQLGDKAFICIVGAGHTHFQENTLLKRYLNDRQANEILAVNMLCKNCYNTSYYGTVLSPLAGDFEDKDEEYFKKLCDEYCKPGDFTLINQRALRDFPNKCYPVATYYALFKDQPKW